MTGLSLHDEVTLNEDVYSNFDIHSKDRKLYGKKMDKVTVVFESLPALIVETKKGERFTVNVNKVIFKSK